MSSTIEIKNKKAEFLYFLKKQYTAGIQLTGSEVKSIRDGKASLSDSYCFFKGNELFIKMHITEYSHGGYSNHEPKRDRKLLLNRQELRRLMREIEQKGSTIVPLRLFFNEAGRVKIEIAVGQGKKAWDKREDVREKDSRREMDRMMSYQ